MTKEKIEEFLNSKNRENYRKLLAFCKDPRTFNELEKSGVKGDLFKVLVDLKTSEAIAFANGKYFTTQLGLDSMKSPA